MRFSANMRKKCAFVCALFYFSLKCYSEDIYRGHYIGIQTRTLPGASPLSFVRGDGIHRHQNPPTPKIYILLGFSAHFILNWWKMQKLYVSGKKDTEISLFLGGRPPLIFRLRGDGVPPVPPLSTPMIIACLPQQALCSTQIFRADSTLTHVTIPVIQLCLNSTLYFS